MAVPQERSPKNAGRAPNLAAFLRPDAKAQGQQPPEGYRQSWHGDERPLLIHEATGIVVWPLPLRPPGRAADPVLLYHYTTHERFDEVCRSRDCWARLATKCAAEGEDAHFGEGVCATSRAPGDFRTKEAVLVNNHSNARDSKTQLEEARLRDGMADYCVPLLVSRRCATNVAKAATGEMSYGPGIDRNGEHLRSGRDIWVVSVDVGLNPTMDTTVSMEQLAVRMADEDAEVREGAVVDMVPLAERSDGAAVDMILQCLEDTDPKVRRTAMKAMGSLVRRRDERAVDAIRELFDETESVAREAAAEAEEQELPGAPSPTAASAGAALPDEPAAEEAAEDAEWSWERLLLGAKILALFVVNLSVLSFGCIFLAERMYEARYEEGTDPFASLGGFLVVSAAVFAAAGAASAGRYLKTFFLDVRTNMHFQWFQNTFKVRLWAETPTAIAIILSLIFFISGG